jgi:hypothetical protein
LIFFAFMSLSLRTGRAGRAKARGGTGATHGGVAVDMPGRSVKGPQPLEGTPTRRAVQGFLAFPARRARGVSAASGSTKASD